MILKLNECVFLGKQLGVSTPLSLFSNLDVPLDGTEMSTLTEKGYYVGQQMTDEVKAFLEVVSKAEKSSKLILNDTHCIVEKYTYRYGDQVVLVENDLGELNFKKGSDINAAVRELSEFFGITSIKNAQVDVFLSESESVVLMTLVDLYRHDELMRFVGETTADHNITLDQLKKEIANPTGSSLTRILRNQYEFEFSDEETIHTAIENLSLKECLNGKEGLVLNENLLTLAQTFLIPDVTLLLEQYQINEAGELVVMSGFVISGGLRNHLGFLFDSEGINVTTLSSLQSIQMTENFLKL